MFSEAEIEKIVETNCGTAEEPKPLAVIQSKIRIWELQLKFYEPESGRLRTQTKEEQIAFLTSLRMLIEKTKKMIN